MRETIRNLDDYDALIARRLRTVRHFERCLFVMWCADRMLDGHAEVLAENLSKPDLRTLRRIIKELWETLLGGVIPVNDQLYVLDLDFMEIDTGWADPTRVIHPIAIIATQTVGLCILSCRRKDVELTHAVAQSVIECLDDNPEEELEEELEEEDPDDLLDVFFERPEVQHEIEIQLAMIRHLRDEYELTPGLRNMFR